MTPVAPGGGFPPVAALVPHGGRMVLLDEVLDAGPGFVACRVRVHAGSTFAEHGEVPALVALEYMAQAVAVYAGLRGRERGEPPRIGFLLGTRELVLEVDAFQPGDELRVEVRHEFGDDRIGAFACAVHRGGRRVASASLNVYQGEDVPA